MAKHGKEEMAHYAYKYGSDKQFLKWASEQPSIIDGTFNQYNPNRNIACHVRRQKDGAGMGIKPPFSAVPMTQEQHDVQTKWGEEAAYRMVTYFTDEQFAKIWFEKKRDETVSKWIEHRKGKL